MWHIRWSKSSEIVFLATPIELCGHKTRRIGMSGNSTLNALEQEQEQEQEIIAQLPATCVCLYDLYCIIEVEISAVMLQDILPSPVQVGISFHIIKCAGWRHYVTVFLLYDDLLTLSLEKRYIWAGNLNIMKILFIMNRNSGLISVYGEILLYFIRPITDAVSFFTPLHRSTMYTVGVF